MSNLAERVRIIVNSSVPVFISPSEDSQRPEGVYVKGNVFVENFVQEFQSRPEFADIPIVTKEPKNYKPERWYVLETDNLFTNPNP